MDNGILANPKMTDHDLNVAVARKLGWTDLFLAPNIGVIDIFMTIKDISIPKPRLHDLESTITRCLLTHTDYALRKRICQTLTGSSHKFGVRAGEILIKGQRCFCGDTEV